MDEIGESDCVLLQPLTPFEEVAATKRSKLINEDYWKYISIKKHIKLCQETPVF
jgi:hypothetical protein